MTEAIFSKVRLTERLSSITQEEWQEIHNPEKCNALTVTKLVQYMGLGYDAPYRVLKKPHYNAFVEGLLEYGRSMEEVAVRVIEIFKEKYKFKSFDVPAKNEIFLSTQESDPITDRFRRNSLGSSEEKYMGRPLYGSPDLLALDEGNNIHVIEIKCPRDSVCLADLETEEAALALFHEKAYINSKNPRILKKLFGHALQACIYAWILSNGGQDPKIVSQECTLMYFYPDIASNRYMIIAYDIDWEAILDSEYGWDLELVIQDYYKNFIPTAKYNQKPDPLLMKIRRGIYPLLDENYTVKDLFSKGTLRTRMLIAGGESTKEITSYAMGRFLPVQTEKISLEC